MLTLCKDEYIFNALLCRENNICCYKQNNKKIIYLSYQRWESRKIKEYNNKYIVSIHIYFFSIFFHVYLTLYKHEYLYLILYTFVKMMHIAVNKILKKIIYLSYQ